MHRIHHFNRMLTAAEVDLISSHDLIHAFHATYAVRGRFFFIIPIAAPFII